MEAIRPRLGILGGSFDPPHIAHLAIASEACARLGLERVVFVPAAAPPHKDLDLASSAEVRLEMARLAVEDDLRFVESGLEVERGLVYTRDTLDAVGARFPGRDLYFIMGSDSLAALDTWHDPQGIMDRATLAVAPRQADAQELIAQARKRWNTDRIVFVQAPRLALSSTMIRERVAARLPIRYLVPPLVEEYVREHRLYLAPVITRDEAEQLVAARLSEKRHAHVLRVAATAVELARRFGASVEMAELAGLLHDYCRELGDDEMLALADRHGIPYGPVEARRPKHILHGPVAAAELAGRVPPEVAQAIARHTVGAAGMTVLDKCVYLADFLEPGRDFPGVEEVRFLARRSLDEATAASSRMTLLDLIGRGRGVVPAALEMYNESHAGR